jgi:dihydropteroate synthase
MQADPRYDDLIGEVIAFLDTAIQAAHAASVPREHVIIDPGIGFGKTIAHNLCLINRLDALACLDAPILVGSSRKAFIRRILNTDAQADIEPTLPKVETGTQATVAASILKGAHIVRVHDVESTRATADIIDAIRNVPENP